MRALRRTFSTIITLTLLAALSPSSALAQQKCGEVPTVLVVQDRSGSMMEKVGGKTKWDIARAALGNITTQFGDQLRFGLMLYPRWPDTKMCDSGKLTVPPAIKNQVNIITALNKVAPQGKTPLAASLDSAREALGKLPSKVQHVVLVTDGKETCRSAPRPLNAGGSCQYKGGTNFRKCGGCGWQFCLYDGKWSSSCARRPDLFPCLSGQTCDSQALCQGKSKASTTASLAMSRLAAKGITGHVIGFGANVDTKVLQDLAQAGGTKTYQYAANPSGLAAALKAVIQGINCCGNGTLDPGEVCDPKIPTGLPGACPVQCHDGKACTADILTGTACSVVCKFKPVTTAKSGDGCCPAGATPGTDSDCKPSCGNGALDPGEVCDPQIPKGLPGACNLNCDDGDPCTIDLPGGPACNPTCATKPKQADRNKKDGCCPKLPAYLTQKADPDCPPACGPGAPDSGPCVDLCKGKKCPAGHRCEAGKCVPYPPDAGPNKGGSGQPRADAGMPWSDLGSGGEDPGPGLSYTGDATGCDCRAGGAGARGSALLLVALLGLLYLRRRS